MTEAPSSPIHPSRVPNRWVQLIAAIIAMMAIANLQYAWTLFTKPLTTSLHATLAAVQVAFAAFIFCETWLVPFEGYLVDRLGPRLIIGIGGLLVGAGWIGSGYATTTTGLYIWYAIGGIGAGAVYGGCTGNVLKWFPDHRGLCAGIVSGAYGIGTAVTVAPIATMIKTSGYQHTFIFWGILQGIIVFVAAMFIVAPAKSWLPKAWKPVARVHQTLHDMTWWEMLKQPSFYVIYIMMTLVAFGGLVVTAQLMAIAGFYKVDKVTVAFGLSAAILAIQLNRIVNGVTRPLWGWISDHIGRENAMFTAFLIEGLAIWAWLQTIHRPVMFVLLVQPRVLCLGRDFLAVPVYYGGPVRQEMGHYELRNCLHFEGHGLHFCRASGRLRDAQDWFLGTSVLRHDCLRYYRRLHGTAMVETCGCPHDCRGGATRACRKPPCRERERRISARIGFG